MSKIDDMTPEEMKRLLLVAMSDLTYAHGFITGLGHENTYIAEQSYALIDLFADKEDGK